MLVNGKWAADWQPVQAKDAKGGFVRQTSSFRNFTPADVHGSGRNLALLLAGWKSVWGLP